MYQGSLGVCTMWGSKCKADISVCRRDNRQPVKYLTAMQWLIRQSQQHTAHTHSKKQNRDCTNIFWRFKRLETEQKNKVYLYNRSQFQKFCEDLKNVSLAFARTKSRTIPKLCQNFDSIRKQQLMNTVLRHTSSTQTQVVLSLLTMNSTLLGVVQRTQPLQLPVKLRSTSLIDNKGLNRTVQ